MTYRYAQGIVPTVAKYSTAPIGVVKAIPGAAVKSIHSQHDEYYVGYSDNILFLYSGFRV